MIDLTSLQAEQRYLGTLARLWANLERPMINKLKPLIGRQYLDAAKLLEQGVDDVVHAVDIQQMRMRAIFKRQYQRVITTAYYEALKGIEAAEKKDKRAEMEHTFQSTMKAFIANKTATNVKAIQTTTKQAIQRRIAKGIAEGMTHKEIAKDIRKLKGITTNWRATMIARTETHQAFNFATDEAVKGTGMTYSKVWSAVMSPRTRPAHLRANRQSRKQDEPFLVWGEQLMYPGQQNLGSGPYGGSAKNVVNCRCGLTYNRRLTEDIMRRPKPIAVIPTLPLGEVFQPAGSVDEATVWAKANVADEVNFGPMDLDVVNEVNEALHDLIVKDKRKKLGGLKYSEKLDSTARADGDQIFMSHWMKNKKMIDATFGVNINRAKFIRESLGDLREELRDAGIDWRTDALYLKKKKRAEKAIKEVRDAMNRREFIANDAKGLITHEFGHIQENRSYARALYGIDGTGEEAMEAMRELRKLSPIDLLNNKKVADKVSIYATTNDGEHFAEAYVAWKQGLGNRVHPDILKWIKKLDADDIRMGITPAAPLEDIF